MKEFLLLRYTLGVEEVAGIVHGQDGPGRMAVLAVAEAVGREGRSAAAVELVSSSEGGSPKAGAAPRWWGLNPIREGSWRKSQLKVGTPSDLKADRLSR